MKRTAVRGALAIGALGYSTLWATYAYARYPFSSPVDGVPTERIPPSFHAPRDGGRSLHQGIDILARRGTPVRSVAWGVVVKVEAQPRGGKVVLVAGAGALLLFYGHLSDWAPGLRVGQVVDRGALLGTVGDTGNARGTPHLHFEARPLATLLAPIDPMLVVGPRPATPSARVWAALSGIGEKR